MDKEAELLKIEIYSDYWHTFFNTLLTYSFGILITGVFFSLTAVYERLIPLLAGAVLLTVILVVTMIFIVIVDIGYQNKMNEIFDMLMI